MALSWRAVSPSVDFTDASTAVLADDPAAWPSSFSIAGFQYSRFGGASWEWRARRDWLAGQTPFDAGPYEQAARVFRQHGYGQGAEQLLIAQRVQARHAAYPSGRHPRALLDAAYGWSVGYGYRPSRALWALVSLLALVIALLLTPPVQHTMRTTDAAGIAYTTSGPVGATQPGDPCGDGRVRCFEPVLYAIDTVVPLISLDQRTTWYPTSHARWGSLVSWILNLATIAGWSLTSIFLLSLGRLTRSV